MMDAFKREELRAMTPAEKFRQLSALMASAGTSFSAERSEREEREIREVRERFKRLRRAYGV